jgi:F-type H+-transporting ATPase subunit b
MELIAEVLALILMVAAVWRWVYPPLIRAARNRESAIAAGLQQAEEAEARLASVRQEVEKMLGEARSQADEMLSRAHREAAADADEARARARAEADAFAQRARGEIDAERDRALRELRQHEAALVVAAAGRVLGEVIDADGHRRLIERSLTSLEPR